MSTSSVMAAVAGCGCTACCERSIAPVESAVVTVGKMENSLNSTECGCGSTFNVIADSIVMHGTARSFKPEVRETVRQRVGEVAAGVGVGQGAEILTEWDGSSLPQTRSILSGILWRSIAPLSPFAGTQI